MRVDESEAILGDDRGEHEIDYGTPYHERPGSQEINERVQELAADKGVTMAQIALAWQFENDHVDTPIVGTSDIEHLEEAVEVLEVDPSASDVESLEEPYEPVELFGFD